MKTTAMTDDFDKNVAIAQAIGWKHEFNGDHEDPEWFWIPPDDPDGDGEPPDFLNSLDAMHEAEEALFRANPGYYERFWFHQLHLIVDGTDPGEEGWSTADARSCARTAHATARQRAEAFLKTIQAP